MKVLLDTHTFLWAIGKKGKRSRRAQKIYEGPNDLWLSVASVWEILIKVQSGKLALPDPSGLYLQEMLAQSHVEVLPITLDHALPTESLPMHHRDPFDRLLIAQAIEEGWPILTADQSFSSYPSDLMI